MAAKRKEAASAEAAEAPAPADPGRRLCRIASTDLNHNGREYPLGSEAVFSDDEIASLPHILIPVAE